jgi:hypothetical protein
MKARSLSKTILEKMITEEKSQLGSMRSIEKVAKDTEEVDAKDYANSLAKHIDYAKALKLEEVRLAKRIRKVQNIREKLRKRIIENI